MKKLQLAVVALALMFATAKPVLAEDFTKYVITVNGTGQVTTTPDAMNLGFGVETLGKNVEQARSENARRMQAVITQIKGLNIPDLTVQTSGFYVSPIYDEDNKKIKQYQAHNNITVKVENEDSDKLATYATKIIDTALNAGANTSNGPNFYLTKNNKAQLDALKLAVAQAKETAQAAADAAGVKLTGVYTLETYSQPVPMRAAAPRMMEMAGAYAKDTNTPVEAGEFEVNSTVTMRFSFNN